MPDSRRRSLALLVAIATLLALPALTGCGNDSPDRWSVAGSWTGTGHLYLLDGTTSFGTLDEVYELTQDGDRVSGTLTEQAFGRTFRFEISGEVSGDTFEMVWSGPDYCSPPGRYAGPAVRVDDDTMTFVVRGSDCDGSFRVEGEIHRAR